MPFPAEPLVHLSLGAEVAAGLRRPRSSRVPRRVVHPDSAAHGRILSSRVAAVRAIYARRTSSLGVDPSLTVVLTVNRWPDESSLRSSNLKVLDYLNVPDRIVVSAVTDPELTAFTAKVEAYLAGPLPDVMAPTDVDAGEKPDGKARTAPNQAFLDCVDDINVYGRDERVTGHAVAALAAAADADPLLLDFQCWCPEEPADAEAAVGRVAAAVAFQGGGRVLDRTVRPGAGLALLRVEVPAARASVLADLDEIRRIDVLPRADLSLSESLLATPDKLPPVLPPNEDAPIVGVIDSGVRSAHPLLAPAVLDAVSISPYPDGSDGDGHGTLVASLALYGSLDRPVRDREPLKAAGRLVSVKVLDDLLGFADDRLWESDLLRALEIAADAGARIINVSIGDERRPYRPDRATPLAVALDDFSRTRGVVLVVSAGNYRLSAYPDREDLGSTYLLHQLEDRASGLLDPATSALSLTVGALCPDDHQGFRPHPDNVHRLPAGGQGWPSPYTRLGPGAANMVKPELALPGGAPEHEPATGRLHPARHRGVLGAAGAADRILNIGVGTSFAAPVAAHCAVRALAASPDLTPEGVRALVLASLLDDGVADPIEGLTPAAKRDKYQRLRGYGRPDPDRAAASTAHRTVLIGERVLPLDHVHLYTVPIPSSFFDTGGWREVTVALAFSPPTRCTRQQYLGSRMHVEVFRGVSLAEVGEAYIREARDLESRDLEEQGLDVDGDATTEAAAGGIHDQGGDDSGEGENEDGDDGGPTALRSRKLKLQPADTRRGRGANQFARVRYRQRLDVEGGLEYVIAVRNTRIWDLSAQTVPYAVVVALERDENHQPIYLDLSAQLRQQAELRAGLNAEVQVEVGTR